MQKRFHTLPVKGAATLWAVVLVTAWGCSSVPPVLQETPAVSPELTLRLNPDAHTAPLTAILVDKHSRFVVSGSMDGTARVWNLGTGRLEQVLRVPIDQGKLARIYAVALTPDATQVAVAGWITRQGDDESIYIFDRQSGRIEHRIKSLPTSVHDLAYSPDGRYLAAVLSYENGLRVYETSGYRERSNDRDYGNHAVGVDFDAKGRIVTSSYDGNIRLYEPDAFSRPSVQRAAPGGKQPFGIAFSPDGQSIAIGYDDPDISRVDVLSAETLDQLYQPRTFLGRSLSEVAWSPDGRYLFAGGQYIEGSLTKVIRWSQAGRGDIVKYGVTTSSVRGIHPLAGGRLVIAAADPLVALLEADGNVKWSQASEQADFRDQDGYRGTGLQLSHNGDVVEFGFEVFGKQRARFDLKA